jgi:peptide subunit release factor 1 (eRF1)
MITREEIRQLAQFESPKASAITFYFQPQTPQDKSHRQEAILIKDMVREALRRAERNGNDLALRDDLQHILQVAEGLHGNHSRGKAIFACRELGVWRELDVPPRLGHSQVIVNSRFHLKPMVAARVSAPRTCIALVDRRKARIFDLAEDTLIAKPDLEFGPLPKIGKSDGYGGYDAGHRERHIENEVAAHYKLFADSLQALMNQDKWETLLIGCRDEAWASIEPQLHTYVRQRLAGRFLIDPIAATAEQVREYATRILQKHRAEEQQELLREVIGQAQRNSRGAVGLRHVLNALERQEVQTLLVSRDFKSEAVECTNCGHLDTRMVSSCAVCGNKTRELSDVSDALVDLALRNGAEIRFVDNDPALEKAGRVGALLRFRADQNTAEKVAV